MLCGLCMGSRSHLSAPSFRPLGARTTLPRSVHGPWNRDSSVQAGVALQRYGQGVDDCQGLPVGPGVDAMNSAAERGRRDYLLFVPCERHTARVPGYAVRRRTGSSRDVRRRRLRWHGGRTPAMASGASGEHKSANSLDLKSVIRKDVWVRRVPPNPYLRLHFPALLFAPRSITVARRCS